MTESSRGSRRVDVSVSTLIGRSPEAVADYANDPTNAPAWYANISHVEWKTSPPLRVGSQIAFVARFLGRELRYTYEVIEHTPVSFVMRTAQGPFPMKTSYAYTATDDGHTQMTLRNQGTPGGFARLMSPFLRVAMRRANHKDLAALKRLLERDQLAS